LLAANQSTTTTADDPGVVPARQRGDVARAGDELRAIVHADCQAPGDVVLEVRRETAVGPRDRPHVGRPTPAGLERHPADLGLAHVQDLGAPVGEFAGLIGSPEAAVLGGLHHVPPAREQSAVLIYW
jgi:hypothetical protein